MPGSWVTMARRRPVRRLKSDDLPTLGRPTIATSGRGEVRCWTRLLMGLACAIVAVRGKSRGSHGRTRNQDRNVVAGFLRPRRLAGALPSPVRVSGRAVGDGGGGGAGLPPAAGPDCRGRPRPPP